MKRILSIISILFAVALSAGAVKVTVVPPPHAAVGEKFAVTIRVADGTVDVEPHRPVISGCTYIFGPAVTSSRSVSMVNGQRSQTAMTEYTFTYRADKAGQATIPAMTLHIDGKGVQTKPTSFKIDEEGTDPRRSRRNDPVSVDDVLTQSSDRQVKANDVFVRIILNKTTAYEQQAIECTIKLYTKYGIERFMPTLQPEFEGALIQEVDLQPALNQREEYNGQAYLTAVLKKCIIFPQKSGKLTINSGEYDITVVQYENVNMGYISVQSPTRRYIKVKSNSASIEILPLPEPKPAGFNGAVGRFSVESRLVGTTFRTGDAASLLYKVTGTGNIKYIKEPDVIFPTEIEKFSPRSDFKGAVSGSNVTGSTTFEYTFTPHAVGEYDIEVAPFVYFDPESRRYDTIEGKKFRIKVEQGDGDDQQQSAASRRTDIVTIHPGSLGLAASRPAVYTVWYWLLWVCAAAILGGSIVVWRRNMRLNADVQGRRASLADKTARRRLKAAKASLDARRMDSFYTDILTALWGYLSDKLSIPASQLSRDNIAERLSEYGADASTIGRVIDIIDRAEMARYTPGDAETRAAGIYEDASQTIRALERVQKA